MSERMEEMLAKMIQLQERGNELLTEMSGKLDELMQVNAIDTIAKNNPKNHVGVTKESVYFLESKAKQKA